MGELAHGRFSAKMVSACTIPGGGGGAGRGGGFSAHPCVLGPDGFVSQDFAESSEILAMGRAAGLRGLGCPHDGRGS